MDTQIIISIGTLALPWLSGRTLWFVALSLLAVLIQLFAADRCIDATPGMAGVACVFFAFIGLMLLGAGIAGGIARLITNGGGKRSANWRRVFLVAAISHGLAIAIIVAVIMYASA